MRQSYGPSPQFWALRPASHKNCRSIARYTQTRRTYPDSLGPDPGLQGPGVTVRAVSRLELLLHRRSSALEVVGMLGDPPIHTQFKESGGHRIRELADGTGTRLSYVWVICSNEYSNEEGVYGVYAVFLICAFYLYGERRFHVGLPPLMPPSAEKHRLMLTNCSVG